MFMFTTVQIAAVPNTLWKASLAHVEPMNL